MSGPGRAPSPPPPRENGNEASAAWHTDRNRLVRAYHAERVTRVRLMHEKRRRHHAGKFRRSSGWWVALGLTAFLAWGAICAVAAAYATGAILTALVVHPSPVIRGASTAFLGFVMLIIPIAIGASLRRPHELDMWGRLTDAVRRIAQGDFSVRVPTPPGGPGDHPFFRLAGGINHMALELDRAERVRQEFISNVSHEIQTPLTSIIGFATALADGEVEEVRRREYLDIIRTEGERLSTLSDNLLRLAALDDARAPRLESYRLDRQLERIALAAEPQLRKRRLELVTDLFPQEVTGDEALLDHVFTNLLQNAVKFTPVEGTITIAMARETDRARIFVSDTGIGIRQEDQGRIFERFFKADEARSTATGGSGLGLALVKKIVDLSAGRVWVESTPGAGTTLTVELPIGNSRASV